MDANYIDALSSSAYKNNIKNVTNTNNRLAWYEEIGKTHNYLDSRYVWYYAEYIPQNPEFVSFEDDNIYYITIEKKQIIEIEDNNIFIKDKSLFLPESFFTIDTTINISDAYNVADRNLIIQEFITVDKRNLIFKNNEISVHEKTLLLPKINIQTIYDRNANSTSKLGTEIDERNIIFFDRTKYPELNYIKKYKIPIIKKVENLTLTKINDNALYNNEFTDIILYENYHVILKDSLGNQIPFGLNRWQVDSSSGYLVFLDGIPKGFNLPFNVSFYKYVGENLQEVMLLTNGTRQLVDNYVPTESQDIATKGYVDRELDKIQLQVDKMVPPEPPSIDGMEIEVITDNIYSKYYVLSNDLYDKVMLYNNIFTLKLPRFYDNEKGFIYLEVSRDNYTFFEIATLNLLDKTKKDINIDFNDDYYLETYASRGFFKGIEISWTGSKDTIPLAYQKSIMIFRFSYKEFDKIIYSKSITLGFENSKLTKSFIYNKHYFLEVDKDTYKTKFISGINTPITGSKIDVKGLQFNAIQQFKSNEKIAFTKSSLGDEFETLPNIVYSLENPITEILGQIEIPNNYFSESLTLETDTFNLFNEKIDHFTETLNYRIDTVSSEENRCTSGKDIDLGDVIDYGEAWNAGLDLTETNELQMLNGFYQFPNKDFSKNGSEISPLISFDPSFIIKGPDYTKTDKSVPRYVTFLYEIPFSSGVWIKLIEPINIKQNALTKAFNFYSMKIKVDGYTEWLDAQFPYDGVGIVRNLMEGCLVVSKCKENLIYCTFGPKPIRGRLFIRIGIKYESEQMFKNIEIKTNN